MPIRCNAGAWQYQQAQCPICASPNTPIATPSGPRPIAQLNIGDLVYSIDHEAIVAVPVAQIASTPVVQHQVLHLLLDDGAELEISPGHPMANGKPLSSLSVGASLDEAHRVVALELVPYRFARTYDILPSSDSGAYFANGTLLGSTLAPARDERLLRR